MTKGSLPDAKFWRGKRVLVTGHTGFKGAWACLWLRHLGAEVSGYALAPEGERSLFASSFDGDDLSRDIGDVRDAESLASHVDARRPDIVIHMAAQSIVRRSLVDPVGTYATNVMGTVHLMDAVRRAGSVRAVVNVTSDKCYQNNEWVWPYREVDPLGGKDPYSSSKACAELVGQSFRSSFFGADSATAVGSARAGNVIGGGDWAQDRLVPDCIRAFMANRPVQIRNPGSLRPWQHVLEPISGYFLLAERLFEDGQGYAEGWNFGPSVDDGARVGEVVDILVAGWGGDARKQEMASSPDREAVLLHLNSSKARTRLHWRPQLDLHAAIDWTVAWYRRAAEGASARDLCMEQIRKYAAG